MYFSLENSVKISTKNTSTVYSQHCLLVSYFSLVSREHKYQFLPSNHCVEIIIALDFILLYYFIVIKKTVM